MQHVELLAIEDNESSGMAVCLKPSIPFVITHSLVNEIRKLQNKIVEGYFQSPWEGVYCLFWYLHSGKIPWKGLDFNYIHQCLINNRESEFEKYLENLFSVLFINYVGLDIPLVSCSIISRKLNGASLDFFYLNRINLIKHHQYNGFDCTDFSNISFKEFDCRHEIKRGAFPEELYLRNNYYTVNSFDLTGLREILDTHDFTPLDLDEKNRIKRIFEQTRDNTIEKIYHLATKNIRFLERLARSQASEYKKNTATTLNLNQLK